MDRWSEVLVMLGCIKRNKIITHRCKMNKITNGIANFIAILCGYRPADNELFRINPLYECPNCHYFSINYGLTHCPNCQINLLFK
jgi:hypothetical protein